MRLFKNRGYDCDIYLCRFFNAMEIEKDMYIKNNFQVDT